MPRHLDVWVGKFHFFVVGVEWWTMKKCFRSFEGFLEPQPGIFAAFILIVNWENQFHILKDLFESH